jgi:phage baseplate assembly protein W
MFEPRDVVMQTLMQRYVEEALEMWEPRILLRGVDVFFDDDIDGAIFVEINYIIRESHDERSIVYPFFLSGEEEW